MSARTRWTAIALLVVLLAACSESSDSGSAVAEATPTPVPSTAAVSPAATPAASSLARPRPSRTSRATAPAPATSRSAALGAPFTLRAGESARIAGTDLVVTFVRVVEDSRCPTNVTCLQAGQARIELTLRHNGSRSTFELVLPATGGAEAASNEQRLGRFVVRLESLDPPPSTPPTGGKPPALTATLRVTRS